MIMIKQAYITKCEHITEHKSKMCEANYHMTRDWPVDSDSNLCIYYIYYLLISIILCVDAKQMLPKRSF